MKYYLILLLLFVSGWSYGQQRSTLTGKVTQDNGSAVPFANILVEGVQKGASANEKGIFEIKHVPTGTYSIAVSAIGYVTETREITVAAGQNRQINFRLEPTVTELQNVEVIGRKEQSYKNTLSFIGAKTEIALTDLPQAVSYATKELMSDQGDLREGDVIKNFSGVSQNTFYDDIVIRGFRINGSQNTQLLNGLRTTTGFWKQPLTNYLERIEVLKGPSSALFGNASPGGVLNRVTKKPLDVVRNNVKFSTGSYNMMRTLGDFTGPLSKDKSLLYRLNIGYENAGSFRDLQFDKDLVIAPSLSFLPTDKTRVNLDLVYNTSRSRLDRGQSTFENDLYSTPTSLSLSSANDFLNEETYMFTMSLNHQFTKALSLSAAFIRTGYNEDLLEHRSANKYAVDGNGDDIPDVVAMQVFRRKRKRYVDNLSVFFNYKLKTGKLSHNLLAGYDYAQQKMPPGGSQLQASGYLSADGKSALQIKSKEQFLANKDKYMLDSNGNPVPNVQSFDLNDRVASQQLKDMSGYIYNVREFGPDFYNSNGVYLQDHLTLGKLKALLGVRYDLYLNKLNYLQNNEENVTQHAFLPRAGLTYSLTRNVNLYGTYVQGYQPQDAANENPNLGGPFDPMESNMMEFGSKTTWFGARLSATIALYKIREKNTLYQIHNSDLMQQIGEEESKGIDVDINGKIMPNWNMSIAYAYNKSSITRDANGMPTNIQKPNMPHHQGNLWTRYNFGHGPFKDLGIGLGTHFVTQRNLQINKAQTIPGYVVTDMALYYYVNKFLLQLNMNNILNKTYWVGGYDYIRLFPGEPHNWLLTFGYSF